MPTALLEATRVAAGYGEAVVLDGVGLSIARGSITAVVGSNGAGKTTLMRSLTGLIATRAGTISFDGRDITAMPADERVDLGIALVPEGRLVFPDMSVHETLRIGAYPRRARTGWRTRLEDIYTLFPRLKERRRQRAGSLSGGEQQMLALGRGLMSAPQLLLLDEPSLGLAPIMAQWVFDAVSRIRDSGVTICLVEQNVSAALGLADYAYLVEHGRTVNAGTGAALLADPKIREQIIGA